MIRAAVAAAGLGLVFLLVMTYWGNYRDAKHGPESGETTASATPATETASPDEAKSDSEEGQEKDDEKESGPSVIILTDGVNFREQPSMQGKLIRGLDKGTELGYLETNGSWYKVKDSEGTVGYVSANELYSKLRK